MSHQTARGVIASIDRRTLVIFGGYAVAFLVVLLAQVVALPPLARFGLAVVALASGHLTAIDTVETLRGPHVRVNRADVGAGADEAPEPSRLQTASRGMQNPARAHAARATRGRGLGRPHDLPI